MPEPTWQKSTYSAEAANCVEIATTAASIHIRDSKSPDTSHVTVTTAAWADFISHVAK